MQSVNEALQRIRTIQPAAGLSACNEIEAMRL